MAASHALDAPRATLPASQRLPPIVQGGLHLHRLSAVASCPRCGEENPDRARFCLNCGSSLVADEPAAQERKLVSVLFVDLVGFTERSDQADPEDVRELLEAYHARAKTQVEHYGGVVEEFADLDEFVVADAGGEEPVPQLTQRDADQVAAGAAAGPGGGVDDGGDVGQAGGEHGAVDVPGPGPPSILGRS